jgi:arylsulfatase A-like enzyme
MLEHPNILFIVWDACRQDYASDYAENLNILAEQNISFTNAVSASNWSLPSHASLFSGEYPSRHGSTKVSDDIRSEALLANLPDDYSTYSISANGFASAGTGFHTPFESSVYTNGPEMFQRGLGIHELVRESRKTGGNVALEIIKSSLNHRYRMESIINLVTALMHEFARKFEPIQRIPHPLFAGAGGYTYTGTKNVNHIKRILTKEASTDSPFFLFSNFMDTHRPYKSDVEGKLSYQQLRELNEGLASPWGFLEKESEGSVSEADIDTIRQLYANEVVSVDQYLGEILATLEEQEMKEETIVIVTADHGENLGETDRTGRVRMGHEASMSDAVLNVPLVLANPMFETTTLSRPVSLNGIYDVILQGAEILAGEIDPKLMFPCGETVFSECAATGSLELFERYPAVPNGIIQERVIEDGVVAYRDDWRVVMYSTGEQYGWLSAERVDVGEIPADLLKDCESRLESLEYDGAAELSRRQTELLESLGYL